MIRAAIEQSGGRRFIATVGAGVMTSFLQYMGKLDPAGNTYMLVIIATVGAYIGGNTYQKTSPNGVKE